MIYSKTGEYAVRAILYLARQSDDDLSMTADIAEKEEIPAHYLAKILQKLSRFGFVDSYKGRGGGFKITELGRKTTLLAVVEKIEGPVITQRCVTGLKECSDEYPCPLHDQWSKIRDKIHNLITSQSVEAIAKKYDRTLKSLT